MDNEAFPSDGAPQDLLKGGSGPNIWNKIDGICRDITEIKTDVAYIKGKMEGRNIQSANSTKLKATLIGSLIMGLSGIIVAVIAFFKPA